MTKYLNKFKLKVISEYLKGKSSWALADKYHVPTHSQVLKWVHQFQVNGFDGFKNCVFHIYLSFQTESIKVDEGEPFNIRKYSPSL